MKDTNLVLQGNNIEILKLLMIQNYQVDSVVTDPPYGLSFMGSHWDYDVPSTEFWKLVYQVLKPGGHVLSFGGTRTYHRMVVNMEDAGFEIRDMITWNYGSGFPKSHNIGKAIEATEQTGKSSPKALRKIRMKDDYKPTGQVDYKKGRAFESIQNDDTETELSETSIQWSGWGTALKPSLEPIVLARKPLSESTVAKNVLALGTGAINIDGCRIGNEGGRWPANSIFDEEAGKILDGQSGITKSGSGVRHNHQSKHDGPVYGKYNDLDTTGFDDSGGASRFFYCAKANQKERNGSKHPTVKPLKLMQYLCRLITPPNGTVLDPFAGSGTTGEAALLEGFRPILIEREKEYIQDIKNRLSGVKKERKQPIPISTPEDPGVDKFIVKKRTA